MTYYPSLTHLQGQLKVIASMRCSLMPCSSEPLSHLERPGATAYITLTHGLMFLPGYFMLALFLSSCGNTMLQILDFATVQTWACPFLSLNLFPTSTVIKTIAWELDQSELKLDHLPAMWPWTNSLSIPVSLSIKWSE